MKLFVKDVPHHNLIAYQFYILSGSDILKCSKILIRYKYQAQHRRSFTHNQRLRHGEVILQLFLLSHPCRLSFRFFPFILPDWHQFCFVKLSNENCSWQQMYCCLWRRHRNALNYRIRVMYTVVTNVNGNIEVEVASARMVLLIKTIKLACASTLVD